MPDSFTPKKETFSHKIHVRFDPQTGKFVGYKF
jgi:hypothetical protein